MLRVRRLTSSAIALSFVANLVIILRLAFHRFSSRQGVKEKAGQSSFRDLITLNFLHCPGGTSKDFENLHPHYFFNDHRKYSKPYATSTDHSSFTVNNQNVSSKHNRLIYRR